MTNTQRLAIIRTGIFAGAAGGLAEIAWVTLYAGLTGADPAVLARGVTTAAGVTALLPAAPVALGIGVHMVLAVMLGVVLTFGWQALSANRGLANPYPFMLAAGQLLCGAADRQPGFRSHRALCGQPDVKASVRRGRGRDRSRRSAIRRAPANIFE
jgi:hypothetical protein